MDKVRFGIIGLGNMGGLHLTWINEIPEVELTAVCDIDAEKADRKAKEYNVRSFHSADELFASGCVDAVLIAVPHYSHTPLAIEAFKHGLHVLCEKPIAVTKSDAQKMIDEHAKHPELRFGLMFQQRTHAAHKKIKKLIDSGEFGRIQRVNWIITDWFRSQSYYDSGSWRATWAGEGGGVLLNQAPHNLDLWQWICGMPVSVTAQCEVAKYHHIEVEDEATLFTRYANGATGLFITSTGEFPGTNRLEISGELGKLVLEEGKLKWWKLRHNEREVRFGSQLDFAKIDMDYTEIVPEEKETAHAGILQNFANAILEGEPLLSPGEDGINELTLSNAAYLSQWQGNVPVTLPLDGAAFDRLLAQRAATSTYHDAAQAGEDASGQYSQRWQVNW